MLNRSVMTLAMLALLSAVAPFHAARAAEQPGAAPAGSAMQAPVDGTAALVANQAEADKVQQALDEMIRAYEMGNIAMIQNNIDPTMLGYQRFLNGVRQDVLMLRQIRIRLLNTQIVVGPDVAVVQTDWQKRYFAAANLAPGEFSGHSIILMHRGETGWRIAAFSGDNMFASQSGTLGQISTVPGVITPVAGVGPPTATVQIVVVDPDLANISSVTVQVVSPQGDRESVALTSTSPGRFTGSLTVIVQSTYSAGDGTLQVQAVPTTMYVRYMDNNPGNNRPPSMLTKTVPIQ